MGLGRSDQYSATRPTRVPDDDPLLEALKREHAAQAPAMNAVLDLIARSGVVERVMAKAVADGLVIHSPAGALLWNDNVYGIDEIAGEGEVS